MDEECNSVFCLEPEREFYSSVKIPVVGAKLTACSCFGWLEKKTLLTLLCTVQSRLP